MSKIDINDIAKRLGGEARGKVSAKTGYFGALALAAEVERRFRKPAGGGRATDPDWTVQRLVRFKPDTVERLEHLARALSERGQRLAPMQVAALLIERATKEVEQRLDDADLHVEGELPRLQRHRQARRIMIGTHDSTTCGNPRHPSGKWHPASPVPAAWEWVERIKQRYRRWRWGCGCPRKANND
jgi:hypothetical protein